MTSSAESIAQRVEAGSFAVLASEDDDHTWELLGDARDVADRLGRKVSVLTFQAKDTESAPADKADHVQDLIRRGADFVTLIELENQSPLSLDQPFCAFETRLAAVERWYCLVQPRILFIAAAGDGRQLAARLASRHWAELLSPALCVRVRDNRLDVTALH